MSLPLGDPEAGESYTIPPISYIIHMYRIVKDAFAELPIHFRPGHLG